MYLEHRSCAKRNENKQLEHGRQFISSVWSKNSDCNNKQLKYHVEIMKADEQTPNQNNKTCRWIRCAVSSLHSLCGCLAQWHWVKPCLSNDLPANHVSYGANTFYATDISCHIFLCDHHIRRVLKLIFQIHHYWLRSALKEWMQLFHLLINWCWWQRRVH